MKTCTVCNAEKGTGDFYLSRGKPCSPCKKCVKAKASVWAQENAEVVRAASVKRRLTADRSAEMKATAQKLSAKRKLDVGAAREKERAYYAANAEHIRASKNALRIANRPRVLETQKRYRATPHGKVSATSRNAERRSMHMRAIPSWVDKDAIAQFYECAAVLSRSGVKFSVDHIVPLKSDLVCGLHVEANLQILPLLINISKSNKHWPDMPGEIF